MTIVPIPLGPTTDPGRSRSVGAAQLINCYVEPVEDGSGKVRYAIYSNAGLVTFVTLPGTGSPRGIYSLGNLFYAIVGEKLYRITSVGAVTLIGNVIGQFPVIWTSNRKQPDQQITIIADTKRYTLTASVLAEITDADLPPGVHSADYIDGKTVFGLNDGRMFWSATNDSSSIDALDFIEAERYPDNGVRVITVDTELWYLGAASLQPFKSTGDQDDFFVPMEAGGGQGYGCLSKHSAVIMDNALFWVTDVCQVARSSQYAPQRISNHAIERDIQDCKNAGTADQITAFSRAVEGHWFYFLCLPQATWVHDAATKLWHKKESYGLTRSRVRFHAEAFGKSLVCDADSPVIYEMTENAQDEAGQYLITTIITAPLTGAFPNGGTINAFWIDAEMGVGHGTDPHSANPQIMLELSTDGQKTWRSPEMRDLGAIGEYTGQIRFNNLGRFEKQGVSFKISVSAPVKRAFLQAYADIDPLEP